MTAEHILTNSCQLIVMLWSRANFVRPAFFWCMALAHSNRPNRRRPPFLQRPIIFFPIDKHTEVLSLASCIPWSTSLPFTMASPSSPNKVRALGRFYEGEAWSSSRNLASGFDEHEQQLIDDGLGRRVDETQQRRNASQNSPPAIPPRPNRSMGKRADTAVAPAAEEEGQEEGDSGNALSNKEGSEPLRVVTPRASNVQELEQQSRQAHQKTQELTVQHQDCERDIQALNDRIVTLEEENVDLTAAGSVGKELRAKLKRRIEDLCEKLAQANLREEALRKELEKSRQIESGLRKQLAGAELQVVQQRLDSGTREFELQRQLRQAQREQEEAAVQGDSVAFIQQQQLENYRLGLDRARLQQENRELARDQSAARSEAEDARQELARLKKRKERKEQARGLYRTRNDRTAV
jgi:hypothetical protein